MIFSRYSSVSTAQFSVLGTMMTGFSLFCQEGMAFSWITQVLETPIMRKFLMMHTQLQGSLVLLSMISRAAQFAVWHVNYLCPNNLLILVSDKTATSTEKLHVPWFLDTSIPGNNALMLHSQVVAQTTGISQVKRKRSISIGCTTNTDLIRGRLIVWGLPWKQQFSTRCSCWQGIPQIIMMEKAHSMANKLPPGSFTQLFCENQLQATKVKDAKSMRWIH